MDEIAEQPKYSQSETENRVLVVLTLKAVGVTNTTWLLRKSCAGGGTRTRTELSLQGILSPLRLPFRHPGVSQTDAIQTFHCLLEPKQLAYLIGWPVGLAFVSDAISKIVLPMAAITQARSWL